MVIAATSSLLPFKLLLGQMLGHAIQDRTVEHRTPNLTNSWTTKPHAHLSVTFLPHIFFEVNRRYIISLVNISVCTKKL